MKKFLNHYLLIINFSVILLFPCRICISIWDIFIPYFKPFSLCLKFSIYYLSMMHFDDLSSHSPILLVAFNQLFSKTFYFINNILSIFLNLIPFSVFDGELLYFYSYVLIVLRIFFTISKYIIILVLDLLVLLCLKCLITSHNHVIWGMWISVCQGLDILYSWIYGLPHSFPSTQ